MRPEPHLHPVAQWALEHLPKWWERIDKDENWRYFSFIGLAVAYGIIAAVAIVQLVRIQLRVPEYGWTTQKVWICSRSRIPKNVVLLLQLRRECS
jgi:Protein of unknown function (DUF1084)